MIALFGVVVIGSAIMSIAEYEKKRVYQNKLNAAVEYSSIGEFNDYDVAVVTKEYLDGSIGYGLINRKYEEVVPCIYSAIRDFYKGMASTELNGKYVVIDNKGQILEKDEYYKIFEGKYESIIKTANKDRLVGKFADGEELLDINLVAISRTYSLINVTTSIREGDIRKYGLYINEIIGEDIYDGFINWEGKEIVSPGDYRIFNAPYHFFKDDKIACIRKKDKFGLINITNGEYVAPIVYKGFSHGSSFQEASSCKISIASRDNGKVLLNTHGKEVSPLYKNIKEHENGKFYVTDFSDNYGVINMYGDEIVKCQPFKIYHDKNGYYVYPSASSPYKDRVYL